MKIIRIGSAFFVSFVVSAHSWASTSAPDSLSSIRSEARAFGAAFKILPDSYHQGACTRLMEFSQVAADKKATPQTKRTKMLAQVRRAGDLLQEYKDQSTASERVMLAPLQTRLQKVETVLKQPDAKRAVSQAAEIAKVYEDGVSCD